MNIMCVIHKLQYTIFHVLPINKKKIVFISHLGKSYSCNPKYLCEYLSKEYGEEFDLVWIYTMAFPTDLPKGVRAVKHFSRNSIYEICTAKYIVSNTRISDWFMFNKRKGQKYIQTWHSSLRLKCIEGDANLPKNYVETAKVDSSKIDVIISGCRFSTEIYKRAFWYKGIVLEVGTPRIDYLLNFTTNQRKEVLNKAGLSCDKRFLLYAPTFRKGNSLTAYNVNYTELLHSLELKTKEKWNILVRLHPNLIEKVKLDSLPEGCIDMTEYADMQELLAICDILITDYSSSMFDMAFMKKICWLYACDLDDYINNERKLYFDINDLPFPLVQNNSELKNLVENFDFNMYERKIEYFLSTIGSYEDGKSCERITSLLVNNILYK